MVEKGPTITGPKLAPVKKSGLGQRLLTRLRLKRLFAPAEKTGGKVSAFEEKGRIKIEVRSLDEAVKLLRGKKTLGYFPSFFRDHRPAFEKAYAKVKLDARDFLGSVIVGLGSLVTLDPSRRTRNPELRIDDLLMQWEEKKIPLEAAEISLLYKIGQLVQKPETPDIFARALALIAPDLVERNETWKTLATGANFEYFEAGILFMLHAYDKNLEKIARSIQKEKEAQALLAKKRIEQLLDLGQLLKKAFQEISVAAPPPPFKLFLKRAVQGLKQFETAVDQKLAVPPDNIVPLPVYSGSQMADFLSACYRWGRLLEQRNNLPEETQVVLTLYLASYAGETRSQDLKYFDDPENLKNFSAGFASLIKFGSASDFRRFIQQEMEAKTASPGHYPSPLETLVGLGQYLRNCGDDQGERSAELVAAALPRLMLKIQRILEKNPQAPRMPAMALAARILAWEEKVDKNGYAQGLDELRSILKTSSAITPVFDEYFQGYFYAAIPPSLPPATGIIWRWFSPKKWEDLPQVKMLGKEALLKGSIMHETDAQRSLAQLLDEAAQCEPETYASLLQLAENRELAKIRGFFRDLIYEAKKIAGVYPARGRHLRAIDNPYKREILLKALIAVKSRMPL